MGKQAYKLKLSKKWIINNVFHMALLEHDTTRKERVDKNVIELDAGNSKEYEVDVIWDSALYTNKLESGHLPSVYYLAA